MNNFYDRTKKLRDEYLKSSDNALKIKVLAKLVSIAFLFGDELPKNEAFVLNFTGMSYEFEILKLLVEKVIKDLEYPSEIYIFEDGTIQKAVNVIIYS